MEFFVIFFTDTDECLEEGGERGHHCSSHSRCINTLGSYTCECDKGYIKLDPYTCRGKIHISFSCLMSSYFFTLDSVEVMVTFLPYKLEMGTYTFWFYESESFWQIFWI